MAVQEKSWADCRSVADKIEWLHEEMRLIGLKMNRNALDLEACAARLRELQAAL